MGDVCVELCAPILVLHSSIVRQPQAALIAIGGLQMILAAALRAMGRQLAARHGHERAVSPFDDLQIANHEAIVERDRAERLESFPALFHQLDSHLSDLHGHSPHENWRQMAFFESARSSSRRRRKGPKMRQMLGQLA
jgi:hypothetical protein